MGLIGFLTAGAVWLVVGLVVYGVLAYFLMFYLPTAEELPNGTVADAAFVLTAPLMLVVTWIAATRRA